MKKIIETIKNIWRIEDLRTRLLITILFVAIYRFGSFIVLPGIDPARLEALQNQTSEGLMSLLNMVLGWCLLKRFGVCVRYHALHFCIDCHPASCHRGALFPKDAA